MPATVIEGYIYSPEQETAQRHEIVKEVGMRLSDVLDRHLPHGVRAEVVLTSVADIAACTFELVPSAHKRRLLGLFCAALQEAVLKTEGTTH